MAFASSNYINAGLAFIWIRLFIQLWMMEKQMSVVSFLVITGAGAVGVFAADQHDRYRHA